MAFGPRKQRTRQHVIADLSVHYVEGFILQEGHTAERFSSDYSYDLVMRTFDDEGRPGNRNPPGHIFEHPQTGAMVALPPFPKTDKVYEHQLLAARMELDDFGIADPATFEAKLRKAG